MPAAAAELQAFWDQMVRIKVVCCYVRLYRDGQAWWLHRLGLFKACVSSGTIAAWGLWKDFAFVWALLIAAAQVMDSVKDYLPQEKHRHVASEFIAKLEEMIIDARFEWSRISAPGYAGADVMARWRRLAQAFNRIETKYFPNSLPLDRVRLKRAEDEAKAYFGATYTV